MNKVTTFVFVLCLIIALSGCGSTEAADAPAVTQGQNDAIVDEGMASDSGVLGDYAVTILDSELVQDYEGNPAIRVYFEFTNNSDEANAFFMSVYPTAYQNGVELDTAFMMDDSEEEKNAQKEIKPGVTLTCAQTFALDDTSPVEVEVTELFSFDDTALTKTFDIE